MPTVAEAGGALTTMRRRDRLQYTGIDDDGGAVVVLEAGVLAFLDACRLLLRAAGADAVVVVVPVVGEGRSSLAHDHHGLAVLSGHEGVVVQVDARIGAFIPVGGVRIEFEALPHDRLGVLRGGPMEEQLPLQWQSRCLQESRFAVGCCAHLPPPNCRPRRRSPRSLTRTLAEVNMVWG